MTAAEWDARIRRAEELSGKFEFAREMLHFYAGIARFQKKLFEQWTAKHVALSASAALRAPLEFVALRGAFPEFLEVVAATAPVLLAEYARDLRRQPEEEWEALLGRYWELGGQSEPVLDPSGTFCARGFLQPYAELLAGGALPPQAESRPVCPRCGGMPQMGVLRPEGDGGRRALICSFCSTEWDYRRIICPACGEEDERKLGLYRTKEFDYIRIEACDSCKTCLPTVDLTKNGLAVPLVDEMAAVPLSLWAGEQGYRKLQRNLLGM